MKFSVAMCVYGGDDPSFFDCSIRSVLENTFKPDQIVLVVDGPVSSYHNEIIEKYEKYLTVYRFEKNYGHGTARRKSLELCRNDIVAIMDADDICANNRFEKQIVVLEMDNSLSIVGGQIEEFIGNVDNVIGKREVPLNDKDIKSYMKKRCPMNLVTVMFKKQDILSVGGFIDWYCEEDYYLWIRMALNNLKFRNVADVLVYVRVGDEMYQRRGGMVYFKSEVKLQNFMLSNSVISNLRWIINVFERLIVQVLLPNKVRGFIFQKIARSK